MSPIAFYLVRHAHAAWKPDENRPLSDRGQRDALRVADILNGYPIEAIVSSTYQRAIQTIQPLATRLELEIQLEPGFRERELGDWTAPSFDEAVRKTWLDPGFAFTQGESNQQAQMRAKLGIKTLLNSQAGQHIVISTHGNMLSLILNLFDPTVGFDFWSGLSMPDVYLLEIPAPDNTRWARIWK